MPVEDQVYQSLAPSGLLYTHRLPPNAWHEPFHCRLGAAGVSSPVSSSMHRAFAISCQSSGLVLHIQTILLGGKVMMTALRGVQRYRPRHSHWSQALFQAQWKEQCSPCT